MTARTLSITTRVRLFADRRKQAMAGARHESGGKTECPTSPPYTFRRATALPLARIQAIRYCVMFIRVHPWPIFLGGQGNGPRMDTDSELLRKLPMPRLRVVACAPLWRSIPTSKSRTGQWPARPHRIVVKKAYQSDRDVYRFWEEHDLLATPDRAGRRKISAANVCFANTVSGDSA